MYLQIILLYNGNVRYCLINIHRFYHVHARGYKLKKKNLGKEERACKSYWYTVAKFCLGKLSDAFQFQVHFFY
jgi:hypothetical protein